MEQDSVFGYIVQTGASFVAEAGIHTIIQTILVQAADYSHTDLACAYQYATLNRSVAPLRLTRRYGRFEVPKLFPKNSEIIAFLEECGKSVVSLSRGNAHCEDILLNEEMKSGIALPLKAGSHHLGALFFNSHRENHYGKSCILYFDALIEFTLGYFQNPLLDIREAFP